MHVKSLKSFVIVVSYVGACELTSSIIRTVCVTRSSTAFCYVFYFILFDFFAPPFLFGELNTDNSTARREPRLLMPPPPPLSPNTSLICLLVSMFHDRYQHQVDAYVPRVNPSQQLLPLLACDLDLLDPETIPWQVHEHEHQHFSQAFHFFVCSVCGSVCVSVCLCACVCWDW